MKLRRSKKKSQIVPAHEVDLFDPITRHTAEADAAGDFVVKKILITPAMAETILADQRTNRPLRKRRVSSFARLIETGKFRTTSQGLSFDTEGSLADGQHRLAGIVAAGVSVDMWVTFGLSDEDVAVLDEGKCRTVADKARMDGMTGPLKKMSSASRVALAGPMGAVSIPPTTTERLLFMREHHELLSNYCTLAHTRAMRHLWHGGWMGALITGALVHGREKIDPIIERLHECDFWGVNDPIKQLHDRIVRGKCAAANRRGLNERDYYFLTVNAITHDLNDDSIAHLRQTSVDFKGAKAFRDEFLK